MKSLAQVTDASLHSELKRLVGSSNALTAQLLAHLGEVEARGIHRERACSSLYAYCVYELRLSEDEAQRRCRAARLARQFPILLEMLAEASLHLTGLLLLGPHLTDENCAQLLARARFRTKREIERLVAEIAPCQDVPSRIVPLHRASASDFTVWPLDDDWLHGPLPRPRNTWANYVRGLAGEMRQLQAGCGAGQAPPRASDEEVVEVRRGHAANGMQEAQDGETGTCTPASDEPQDQKRDQTRNESRDEKQCLNAPLPSGEAQPTASVPRVVAPRYKVQFTADQAYVDLLEEARNLLQHELPTRDLQAVQRRALELLVHQLRRRKYAASERRSAKAAEPVNGTMQPQPKPARLPASATRTLHAVPQSKAHARPPAAHALNSATQSPTRAGHPEPPSQTYARQSTRQSATNTGHATPPSQTTRHAAPPSPAHVPHSAQQLATNTGHATPPSQTHTRRSASRSANQSRYIPADVRRNVWQRDDARCTYVDSRGQRCREQAGLEFHHQHPHGRGGPPTIGNLALRCRAHNALAAEQDFGLDHIRTKRARRTTLAESDRAGAAP
jgi:hypothetical protein